MGTTRRILVVGRSGQVATALREMRWPANIHIEARGRDSLDLRRPGSVAAAIAETRWAAVVNAAAYTQVDRAESEPDEAFAINRDGPAALAENCARAGVPLIHLSTDYVFDGTKDGAYCEDDPVRPISVYGTSKAEGEAAVRARHAAHVILRTSWVFSNTGSNFVQTLLRLGHERKSLNIVRDQYGRPTGAMDIAGAIIRIVNALLDGKRDGFGTFHFAGSGATTWYDFAREIFRQAESREYPSFPQLYGISASEYPAEARRPMNSVLDTELIAQVYGIAPRPWQDALGETLDRLLAPEPAHQKVACS